jgi:chorismate lyase/3-hydroxybenzoate synthase
MGPSLSPAPAGAIGVDAASTLPPLRVEYANAALAELLADSEVLAVTGFGHDAPTCADPRYWRVALEPAALPAPLEVWRCAGRIEHGHDGALRWSRNADYAFVGIELAERDFDGIAATTRAAYARLDAWCRASATPHWLRVWNYVDAINLGIGDDERYRLFCRGRAAGMSVAASYPAASAIGVHDGARRLQVCALVARRPGTAVENPRQVSAWQYPREYGPVAPNFARAMRAPTHSPQLYISGTAAVVGHASHHVGNVAAQLLETLTNLDSLRVAASCTVPLGNPRSPLRVYVRHAADATSVREALQAQLGADTPLLVLLGDICRAELLVEIDGVLNG